MPFEEFLQRVVASGYQGVEMSFSMNEKEREEQVSLINTYSLQVIAQHWETIDAEFSQHTLNFEKRLRNLAATKPLFINSQTGKDYYTFKQNLALFQLSDTITAETGIPILHETHRGKWSFAAHITKEYLQKLPQLKITFDVSHWCNTAESFLEDQAEAVEVAIAATAHIHARVGYTEGPQVPDPRIELWTAALEKHTAWWDRILALNKQQGKESFTITPEFGAPPYMVLHPQTTKPLIDQWEVNVWMKDYLTHCYQLMLG